jgi:hypothetical protein
MNERKTEINDIFKQYISPSKFNEYMPVSEYNDKISRNQALEDLSVLRYLMENRYCGWEYFENNGIVWETCFKKIESFIISQSDTYISDFCKTIHEAFDVGIVDNHLSFCSPATGRLSYSKQYSAYFADFKVEQKAGIFYAAESKCPNIANGDIIDAGNNLYPTLYNKYLVGLRSFDPVSEMTVSVNGKPSSVSLHRCKAIKKTDFQDICLHHDIKSGIDILRSNCCDYVGNITEKTDFEELGKQFREKKVVVLNFISNDGGYNRITREFIKGLNGYSHCREYSIKLKSPVTEGRSCNRRWETLSEAKPYDYSKAKYNGKLIMLVNGGTASAGESAILYAKSCKDFILIGENTMGCNTFGNVASYELTNSHIVCRIPNTVNLCADSDDCIEGHGFTPDYWVDSDDVEGEVIKWIQRTFSSSTTNKRL